MSYPLWVHKDREQAVRRQVEEMEAQLRSRGAGGDQAQPPADSGGGSHCAAWGGGDDGQGAYLSAPATPAAGDAFRAQDLLLSKLGEYGFSALNVSQVLSDIQTSRPAGSMDVTVNEVLDRLLTGDDDRGGSAAAAGGSGGGSGGAAAVAQAAPAPKKPSSLFGGDDGDDASYPGTSFSSAASPSSSSSSATATVATGGGGSARDRTSTLPSAASGGGGEARVGGGAAVEGKPISYRECMDRLVRQESADLAKHVRLFVRSVLGPNGDGSAPSRQQATAISAEYTFYGSYMLKQRCEDFVEAMGTAVASHPGWRDLGDAGLQSARNHIEKYVLTKLGALALASERDEPQDAELLRRMEVLDFIQPQDLEVTPSLHGNAVLLDAMAELRRMGGFKAPGDKIACVVKCAQLIFSALNAQKAPKDAHKSLGADDFLPVFIFVVLKSKVPGLYSQCEYIQNYHNRAALVSKAGYCFVNLQSAVDFILTLDASVLAIDEQSFTEQLAAAEEQWAATRKGQPTKRVDAQAK